MGAPPCRRGEKVYDMTNLDDNQAETRPNTGSKARSGTFQFAVGGRLITVTVPLYLILLLVFTSVSGYLLGNRSGSLERQRQADMLSIVKERNVQLERSLEEKEQEREELVALAESRSSELWSELDVRDRELRRLWTLVGKPSEAQPRRQSLASRGADATAQERYRALQSRLDTSNGELRKLALAARQYKARTIPSGAPCKGEMTSDFGYRIHPLYGFSKLHNGCDFTADYGTKIYATADGQVVRSEWYGGYGNTVEIQHASGLKTLYAHCEELKVKKGQSVKKGELIATVGTTGLSSGPHCHYEVHKNGKPIDPKPYLRTR